MTLPYTSLVHARTEASSRELCFTTEVHELNQFIISLWSEKVDTTETFQYSAACNKKTSHNYELTLINRNNYPGQAIHPRPLAQFINFSLHVKKKESYHLGQTITCLKDWHSFLRKVTFHAIKVTKQR